MRLRVPAIYGSRANRIHGQARTDALLLPSRFPWRPWTVLLNFCLHGPAARVSGWLAAARPGGTLVARAG